MMSRKDIGALKLPRKSGTEKGPRLNAEAQADSRVFDLLDRVTPFTG
jgi:hypothetical protein